MLAFRYHSPSNRKAGSFPRLPRSPPGATLPSASPTAPTAPTALLQQLRKPDALQPEPSGCAARRGRHPRADRLRSPTRASEKSPRLPQLAAQWRGPLRPCPLSAGANLALGPGGRSASPDRAGVVSAKVPADFPGPAPLLPPSQQVRPPHRQHTQLCPPPTPARPLGHSCALVQWEGPCAQ